MSSCPTKRSWKLRIFDATEGYRVKAHAWSPHAISGVPYFVSCNQFFSKHDLHCKQRILGLGLVLISSGEGGPLQSGCMVFAAFQAAKLSAASSVLRTCASLDSLTKKRYWGSYKKQHFLLHQICSKSQPTTICDCDSVSVCQCSIANAVLWALLHCDTIAQCSKEVHNQ